MASSTLILMENSLSNFCTDVRLPSGTFMNGGTCQLQLTLGDLNPISGTLDICTSKSECGRVLKVSLTFKLLSGNMHGDIFTVLFKDKSTSEMMVFQLNNSDKDLTKFKSFNAACIYLPVTCINDNTEMQGCLKCGRTWKLLENYGRRITKCEFMDCRSSIPTFQCKTCSIDTETKDFYNTYQDFNVEFIMPLSPELLKKLNTRRYLLQTGNCSDFQIIVDNETTFKVHSFILSECSPIFKEMINAESTEKKEITLCVNDFISPENFHELLKFIYDGTVDLKKGVHEIFKAAHRYKIDNLIAHCKKFLISNIDKVDIVQTLDLIFMYHFELSDVKEEVDKYIKNNEENLIKNKDFLQYFINKMDVNNFHYIFDLSMRYELNNKKDIVKNFIRKNQINVLENYEYRKLLMQHPEWAIELLTFVAQSEKTDESQ